ncbi:hypothetical protein [Hydrocarboniphaga effusa]|uniref:hypothetical protein n=1 Tax=Hydrocarboniphaga effusa TaxID=243629 RepID=UPI003BAB87F6
MKVLNHFPCKKGLLQTFDIRYYNHVGKLRTGIRGTAMRQNQRSSQAIGPLRAAPLALRLVEAWEAERAQRGRAKRGMRVELKICVSDRGDSPARSQAALRLIERWCLKDYRPRRLQADGSLIELALPPTGGSIDQAAQALLERIRSVGNDRDCEVDAVIRHRDTSRVWS